MQAPDFWQHDGLTARLLAPLGHLYAAAGRHRRRRVHAYRAPVPVLCVGNLTVGGTGKTPVALALAERLIARGIRPHFLSRGYAGRSRGPLQVDRQAHGVGQVGDEPLLLAAVAPTWVARERAAGARAAAAAGAELLILDDGFQNPSLAHDLALVVVDGAVGFGNGRVLPAGPLREPVAEGLARAQAVVVLGPDRAGLAAQLPPGLARLDAVLEPQPDAHALTGRRVVAFAGIGRPDKLFDSLRDLGADLVSARSFPDHHPFSQSELEALLALSAREGAQMVTTSKDAVRLPPALRSRVTVLQVKIRWCNPDRVDRILNSLVHHAPSP